jgi:hypothetical protein
MLLEACAVNTAKEPKWIHSFEQGLVMSLATRKPMALKPLGQGIDAFDGW